VSERPVRRAYRLQTVLFVHGTRFADLLPEGTSMEFKDVVPVEGVLRLVTHAIDRCPAAFIPSILSSENTVVTGDQRLNPPRRSCSEGIALELHACFQR